MGPHGLIGPCDVSTVRFDARVLYDRTVCAVAFTVIWNHHVHDSNDAVTLTLTRTITFPIWLLCFSFVGSFLLRRQQQLLRLCQVMNGILITLDSSC